MNERELLDILVRFATTLTDDFSIHDVLDHLVERIVHLLPITGAGVLLMDGADAHHFVTTTDEKIRGVEGIQVDLQEGPCLVAYETDRCVAIPDLATDQTMPRFSAVAADLGLGAVFSFPLRHGGDRVGALELYATEPVALSTAELDGAQTLADVVASYLLIARRRDAAAEVAAQLAVAAMHDPLTGLANRRLLADRLEQAEERARRSGLAFAVLFCDIDRFKAPNDRYGHHAGDALLVEVARRLTQVLRPQDTLARVSGDEFVIVCEDLPDPTVVERVAERTLAALAEPIRLDEHGANVRLHMSIGIAIVGADGADGCRALADADIAMYRAKRRGGGQHVFARQREGRPVADPPPARQA